MWKKIAMAAVIVLAVAAAFWWQDSEIKSLRDERDRYRSNQETLLGEVEKFRIDDSLSGAKVKTLELTLREFERQRAEDAATIKRLKVKNRDLEAFSKVQSQTIVELSTKARDTIIYRDSSLHHALALHTGDAWYSFDGILDGKDFSGNMTNRDSLVIAESVEYARFLGFLWRTKKVKKRDFSVLSKNPHTTIEGVEHTKIEK